MYKIGKLKPKYQPVNFILQDGGVGDHMASLVAINYVEKRYPWIKPLVWTPNYLVDFAKNVLARRCQVNSYSDMKQYYNSNLPTKSTKWDGIISPMKIHLLDYAFLKLCDENPGIEHKNYLNKKSPVKNKVPDRKYVVVTTGYTAKAREFKVVHINAITKYIKMKGYTPVFLGATKAETGARHIIEGNFDKNIDFEIGQNLVNHTTLLEALAVMEYASAVIGVDNGLLHVAGCTDTPIVGGFPSVSPEIRMPVRNNILGYDFYPVVPDEGRGCNYCQETTNFLYGHDYRECIYKDDRSINQMTAEKFIEKLELIL